MLPIKYHFLHEGTWLFICLVTRSLQRNKDAPIDKLGPPPTTRAQLGEWCLSQQGEEGQRLTGVTKWGLMEGPVQIFESELTATWQ